MSGKVRAFWMPMKCLDVLLDNDDRAGDLDTQLHYAKIFIQEWSTGGVQNFHQDFYRLSHFHLEKNKKTEFIL